jgi:hypothetical protein
MKLPNLKLLKLQYGKAKQSWSALNVNSTGPINKLEYPTTGTYTPKETIQIAMW